MIEFGFICSLARFTKDWGCPQSLDLMRFVTKSNFWEASSPWVHCLLCGSDHSLVLSLCPHLASDVLLDEVVLALVREDDVHLLGGSADVRSEHHVVRRLTVEISQVDVRAHHLEFLEVSIKHVFVSIFSIEQSKNVVFDLVWLFSCPKDQHLAGFTCLFCEKKEGFSTLTWISGSDFWFF